MLPNNTESEFALCLTHDVDRPYKSYQSVYYAREDPAYHLGSLLRGENPYWQFEAGMELEDDLGVRSAWYFLNEPPLSEMGGPREWLRPVNWVEHFGRYDVTSPDIVAAMRALADGGWEVGLHGSRRAATDPTRLAHEKSVLEGALGEEVVGGRHHHLTLGPDTWRQHDAVGLRYDASLGWSTEYGFTYGYDPLVPFDDFVVYPLTAMEVALPDPDREFDRALAACEGLLKEAEENGAVMSVLWHPRYFNEREFPGYRRLYRRLIAGALDRDAWVGPPAEYDAALRESGDHPDLSAR